MQKVLIATTNPGKTREYKQLLSDLPVSVVSLKDVGIDKDVDETGGTYEENAKLKATTYANLSGLPAISDDGGIEIDALGGKPGLHSRRWVGGEGKDEDIIRKMKEVAKELPDNNRRATFNIVVAFALPNGEVWTSKGFVEGIIAREPQYNLLHGYPYRSFFYIPTIKKFYQELELTEEEAQQYNHRLRAVIALKKDIRRILNLI